MKFHQLTLYNIKNLRGTYFLDFDMHFGSEELFLIFGELGTGKTTIFDGISLALYGQTPQLQSSHTAKTNDSIRHILNTECEKCFVSLVFSFLGEEFYRATWHFQNLRGNKTSSAPKRTLQKLNSKFEVEETLCSTSTKKEFEPYFTKVLRGLSFNDFIRSVFLPQNQFTTFIREEPKKRTEILERITNTEIYAKISEKVEEMSSQAKKDVQKLEAKLYGLPSPDQVRGLQARAIVLKELLSFGEVQKQACILSAEWSKIYAKKMKNEANLVLCIDNIVKLKSQLTSHEQLYVQKEKEVETLEKELRAHKTRLEEHNDLFVERKAYSERFAVLSAAVIQSKSELKRVQNKLKAIPKTSVPLQSEVEKAEAEYTVTHESLIALLGEYTDSTGKPDMHIQGDLRTRYRTRIQYLDSRLQKILDTEKAHQRFEEHCFDQERYKKALFSIQSDISKKEAQIQNLETSLLVVEKKHRALQTDIQLYQVRLQPQALRKELKDGEPCSVCGSVEHPFHGDAIEEEERFALRLKEIQAEFSLVEADRAEQKKSIQSLRQERIRLEERIRNGTEKVQEKKKMAAESKEECERSLKELGIHERADLEPTHIHIKNYKMNLEESFQSSEDASKRYNFLIKERSKGIEQENQRDRLVSKKSELENHIQKQENEKQKIEQFQKSISQQLCEAFAIENPEEIASLQVEKKYAITQKYEKEVSRLALFKQEKKQKEEKFTQLQKQETEEKETYNQLLKRYTPLQEKLDKLFTQIKEGPEAMFPPDAAFEECVQICIDSEKNVVYRILEWEKETKDNEDRIKLYEENKEEIKSLDVLKKQAEGWLELRNALNLGLKFREFAQAWQLQNLINRANIQLQQILKGYHLSPVKDENGQPKLDFNVSKGGESERPITTLSGGESFSIALAFALALGNLRKIHMPIQTLLIDEGFGNLDHQSADMVVSGLESLKQKNIQVGLISHVQTLQERIAARISVNDLFVSPQRITP